MISIILPTYNEAENIPLIVPKIYETLKNSGIEGEIIIVDDNSPDGTASIAEKLAEEFPVRVHTRKRDRGLSKSVIKGFELAKGNILVIMDADLSHPIKKLPAMLQPIIENRCNATIGSRYISEGGFENLPLLRKIVSKGAGLLAKGLTNLSDPTSGFMAIKKEIIEIEKLDSLGWKIVLEVITKTDPLFIEVPIVFADRKKGQSKLGAKAQVDYIRHLWKLYCYKFPNLFQFIKFCMVGISGIFIDTAVLVTLVELGPFDPRFAAFFAFIVAVSWNYVLNRTWTFNIKKKALIAFSYISFVSVCAAGLGIRIGIMHLLIKYAGMKEFPLYVIASLTGIIIAMLFNFFGSRYFAFRTSNF